jgi:hypothetical protein
LDQPANKQKVIGGAVKSNLTSNALLSEISPTSLYYPIRTHITKAVNSDWNNMPASQFAKKLVSKLTQKRKPAMVYLGSKLWFAYLMQVVAWFASWFVGVKFWDLVIAPAFGMRKLKQIVEKKERDGKKEL